MKSLLKSTVEIIRFIDSKKADSFSTTGFIEINTINIDHIKLMLDNKIIDIVTIGEPDDIRNIFKEDIDNFIGKQVYLDISTGDVNCYFETINDFLNGNRFKLKNELFYIAENDYYSDVNKIDNELVKNYNKNIELVDFLYSLSHSQHQIGNQLKYYFYRISNSIVEVDIKYSVNDLIFLSYTLSICLMSF